VVGSCECGNEPSGSCSTELVRIVFAGLSDMFQKLNLIVRAL
jgi:hypothetical protein